MLHPSTKKLQHTATHCNALQHTATHRNALQHTAAQDDLPYYTPQQRKGHPTAGKDTHTATHCNTLQHTATHCNALQHIATHCNTGGPTAGKGARGIRLSFENHTTRPDLSSCFLYSLPRFTRTLPAAACGEGRGGVMRGTCEGCLRHMFVGGRFSFWGCC